MEETLVESVCLEELTKIHRKIFWKIYYCIVEEGVALLYNIFISITQSHKSIEMVSCKNSGKIWKKINTNQDEK